MLKSELMKRPWIQWALLAALSVATTACSRKPQTPEERTIRVRTITATEDPAPQSREYVGVIEEASASVLSFPVAGTIRTVFVREGERVGKGKLLAELETANLRSTHEAAQATLRQAEDAMRRLQQLYDNGSLPEIQFVEAQTKLTQARALAEVAAKNLSDSRLTAPYDGVIGRRNAETGENVLPGQPVLTLCDTRTVMAKISVPESEIATLHTGDRSEIRVAALSDRLFRGTVSERGIVGNALSHSYEVKIRLENRDGTLLPGMVCNASLHGAESTPAIILPARAVQVAHTGSHFVWTVKDGYAVRTAVITGPLTERGVTIVSGLRCGDRVITEGTHKVGNGTKVEEL